MDIIELYQPTAGAKDRDEAFAALGLEGDDTSADAFARYAEAHGVPSPEPDRQPTDLLLHLRALLETFPWLATLARMDRTDTAISVQLEQAIGNYLFVDCHAAYGMTKIEGHRLRAFMENGIDEFRVLAARLFDTQPQPA